MRMSFVLADCVYEWLQSLVLTGRYNSVGLVVRKALLLLVEAECLNEDIEDHLRLALFAKRSRNAVRRTRKGIKRRRKP